MIKAIITDIDGVIVGDKKNINFPLPNDLVIQKLRELHKKGLPIILCTAKFKSGIIELVEKTKLSNPHITDGGALIVDPFNNTIVKKHVISRELTKNIINTFIKNNIYIEVYAIDNYFVQTSQICEITDQHTQILQQKPKIIKSIADNILDIDVIKIITFSKNQEEKQLIKKLLITYNWKLHSVWTIHPTMLPAELCILTVEGVSKRAAAQELLEYLKISSEDTLGIGDTLGDWNFMSLCRYVATVGEVDNELKEKVKSKGEGNYFFGPSVDENGILDIFNFFIK